jgi:hypothetical protein
VQRRRKLLGLDPPLPATIHLKVDPEAITPATTLAKIREAALARQH